MEWIWRPYSESLGKSNEIFTHAFYHHYSSPEHYNFDILDGDDMWINDPKSEDYNAPEEAKQFAA
jgi:L,D-peptidoglycan transpeptidase YkuD (ErfK/YbiS/YcfS/YnhG family)